MSSYFTALQRKLKDKYKLEIENFKFSGLVGNQRWIRVSVSDEEPIIDFFDREQTFPAVILVEEKQEKIVRLLDLGDDYKAQTIDDQNIWSNTFLYNPVRYIDERLIYSNYLLFGGAEIYYTEFHTNDAEDLINAYEVYGLDFAFIVSEIKLRNRGKLYIDLLPEPLKFIRKGLFWGHKIPSNDNKMTTSSLLPFLKLNLIIAKALEHEETIDKLFTNRFALLDYYEQKIFPKICLSKLNKRYEPNENLRDFELRVNLMFDFLRNNSELVKKIEKEIF